MVVAAIGIADRKDVEQEENSRVKTDWNKRAERRTSRAAAMPAQVRRASY
jgi:hypothetical protein